MLSRMTAIACLFLLSLVAAVPAGATIITIDDFTSDSLHSSWAQSTVLNASNTQGSVAFSTTVNDNQLTATMSGFSGTALQVVLLRDDRALGVGETLMLDLVANSSSSYKSRNGLIIAAAKGITSRQNMMYIALSPYFNNIEAWWFKNDGTYSSAATAALPAGTVAGFYIARTGQHDYDLGYFTTTAPTTPVFVKTFSVSGTGNLDPGAAIGIFTDQRGNGNVRFDNLRMDVAVPEPSTLALLVGGLFGLLAYAWRKRR
jgi:hypothetical protein